MSLQRQGRLGIGLGASAALHAVVALWVLRAPEAPPPPPVSGAPGMELIELQLVSGTGQAARISGGAEARRGGIASRAPGSAEETAAVPEGNLIAASVPGRDEAPEGERAGARSPGMAAVPGGESTSTPAEGAAAVSSASGGAKGALMVSRVEAVSSSAPRGAEARPSLTPAEAGATKGPGGGGESSAVDPSEAGAMDLKDGASPSVAASAATGAAGASAAPPTQLLAARLAEAARRCYPREAVRFRLSGEARLSFCLGADGQASAVSVARSSGAEVLDRAAAECVLPRALPVPGAAGCYELPVRFTARQP